MPPRPDFDSIADQVITLLAAARQRPVEEIHLDTRLEDLGVDSLDKVSLAFDMEELYRISIPESALSAIVTVRDIVTGIERELNRQHTVDAENPGACA